MFCRKLFKVYGITPYFDFTENKVNLQDLFNTISSIATSFAGIGSLCYVFSGWKRR